MVEINENDILEDSILLYESILAAVNNTGIEQLIDYYDLFIIYAIQKGIVPLVGDIYKEDMLSYIVQSKQITKIINENSKTLLYPPKQLNIIGVQDDFDGLYQLQNEYVIISGSQYTKSESLQIYKDMFMHRLRASSETPQQQQINPKGIPPQFTGSQQPFKDKNLDNRAQITVATLGNLQKFLSTGIYQMLVRKHKIEEAKHVPRIRLKEKLYKVPQIINKFMTNYGIQSKATRIFIDQYQHILQNELVTEYLQYLVDHVLILKQVRGKIQSLEKVSNVRINENTYILRVMKQIYRQTYGNSISAIYAKSVDEIYALLTKEQRQMMDKQVHVVIQKLVDPNCSHHAFIQHLRGMAVDLRVQETKKWLKQQEIDEHDLPLDFIVCKKCNTEVICCHEVAQFLQDKPQFQKCLIALRFIDAVFNQCKICGAQVHLEGQLVSNIKKIFDKEPKIYGIFRGLVNIVLKYCVKTSGMLDRDNLFRDLAEICHMKLKEKLKDRKLDDDYRVQKIYFAQVYVCAYFYKLNGENLIFDLRAFYNIIKNINIKFDMFQQHVVAATRELFPAFFVRQGKTMESIKQHILSNSILREQYTTSQIQQKINTFLTATSLDMVSIYLKNQQNEYQYLFQIYDEIFNSTILLKPNKKFDKILQQLRNQAFTSLSYHRCNNMSNNQYKTSISYEKAIKVSDQAFLESQCSYFCPVAENHQFDGEVCTQCSYNVKTKKFQQISQLAEYLVITTKYFQLKNKAPSAPIIEQEPDTEIHEYDQIQLEKYAIKYQIQPIYILNLGGFDYVDYTVYMNNHTSSMNSETHKDTFSANIQLDIIKRQIKLSEQSEFMQRKPQMGNARDYQDLAYINDISCNWYIFNARLHKLYQMFVYIALYYKEIINTDTFKHINQFFNKIISSNINSFVKCQISIYWFFKNVFLGIERTQSAQLCKEFLGRLLQRDSQLSSAFMKQILQISKIALSDTKQPQQQQQMTSDDAIQELGDDEQAPSEKEDSEMDEDLMDLEQEGLEPEQ